MRHIALATACAVMTLGGVVAPADAVSTYQTTTSGQLTTVSDGSGWAATFTTGARTVTVRGPQRVLAESGSSARVTTSIYVRLLPAAFSGTVDATWLSTELADRSPDLLAVALQYVGGAPAITDGSGRRIAGDASYGPLQADGTRAEGSDFNDYLGVSWTYGTTVDRPETDQLGSLDCSGFTRMVFGYRGGFPLALDPDGRGLPRRSAQIAASAPGPVMIANTGARPASLAGLRTGDLVLFDASTNDGTAIDHVGIYLGPDSTGKPRFISSRRASDGPTMGDAGAMSVLTGTGFYARAFREARRL